MQLGWGPGNSAAAKLLTFVFLWILVLSSSRVRAVCVQHCGDVQRKHLRAVGPCPGNLQRDIAQVVREGSRVYGILRVFRGPVTVTNEVLSITCDTRPQWCGVGSPRLAENAGHIVFLHGPHVSRWTQKMPRILAL